MNRFSTGYAHSYQHKTKMVVYQESNLIGGVGKKGLTSYITVLIVG
jgi:hypothetical protein